jgi:hypothetical protein
MKLILMMASRKFDPRVAELVRLLFEQKPKRRKREKGRVIDVHAAAVESKLLSPSRA